MLVTDKKYYMEKKLIHKLDLMIARMKHGKDNVLLIDGDEGDGKSNLAAACCYYFAYHTKRKLDLNNVFFDLDTLIDFAIKTKEQIIWWDEAALGGLAADWWRKNQKKFIKLLMVARKKKHFFVICIPKFFKLNEYLVIDRSIGLVHVYLRKGIKHGYFVYFNQKRKEHLWEDWKKSKWRNYKKHNNFRGTFGLVLRRVINEEEYDKKKDIAILSIDKEDETKDLRTFKKELLKDIMVGLENKGVKL